MEKVRKRITEYRDIYEKNEAAVRQQIIDPILRELGWDTEDPEEVMPEENTGENGFPDYSLIQGGKKVILIEVKKMREDTISHIKQLARYSSDVGSKYGLITNGSDFVLFKSYEEFKPYIDRRIWSVNFENDSSEKVIRYLISLSPENASRIEELAKKRDNLGALWDELMKSPDTFSNVFSEYFMGQLAQKFPNVKYDFEEVRDFLSEKAGTLLSGETTEDNSVEYDNGHSNYGNKYYTRMRLQDKDYKITTQNQILINVANWLVEKGKMNKTNVPIESGPKRYLVNKENKNKDGRPLPSGKQINGGLWLMLNLSASNIVMKSYELLERFGYDRKSLELE